MELVFTKQEFRQKAIPTKGKDKEVFEPVMELHPNNKAIYNGVKYKVSTNDKDNTVILTRV